MQRQLLYGAAALLFFAPGQSHAQACPPPQPVATSEQIVAWLDCTVVELQNIWREEITSAILGTYPQFASVKNLELAYVSGCDFSPRLDDLNGDGTQEVIVNTRLLIPQLALSQAILWYLIAPEGLAPASTHLQYLDEILMPAVRADSRLCSRSGEQETRYSATDIPTIFDGAPEAHASFLSLDSSQTRLLGNYVGALPAFFVAIHEAGHAALHGAGSPSNATDRELEADAFAAAVLAASDVPITLGLGFLLIAYDLDRGGTNSDAACRIVALATQAESSDVDRSPELGQQTSRRIEELRREYISYYGERCNAL